MSLYDDTHSGRGEVTLLLGDSAIGSLFGHRAWQIGDDGWLVGDYVHAKWLPGVNTARCYQTRIATNLQKPAFARGSRGPAYNWSPMEPEILEGWEPAPCPGVAKGNHGCGFYVRTGKRYESKFPHIRGVAEAWGDVEFGYEGFRASRARIVGLVKPEMNVKTLAEIALKRSEIRRLKRSLRDLESQWLDEEGIKRMESKEEQVVVKEDIIRQLLLPAKAWPLVALRYPDALVFRSEQEAVEHFPPTDLTGLLEEKP